MRCFILSTGRAGSLTVAKAFSYAHNYTVGHESRITVADESRIEYPDFHIESDNRLSWFVGSLVKRYPDAAYVHLTREFALVADSYLRRWESIGRIGVSSPGSINRLGNSLLRLFGRRFDSTVVDAFARGVIGQRYKMAKLEKKKAVELYIKSVNDNIEVALQAAKYSFQMDIQNPDATFRKVWNLLNAEGEFEEALSQLHRISNKDFPIVQGQKGL